MAFLREYLTVKQAARFLGVAENTMRNWDRPAPCPSIGTRRTTTDSSKKADLERIRKEIQASGTYPSGWQRPRWPR